MAGEGNPLYESTPKGLHQVLCSLKDKDAGDAKQAARNFLKANIGDSKQPVEDMTRAGILLKTKPKYKFKKKLHIHPQRVREIAVPIRSGSGGLSGQQKKRLGLHMVGTEGKCHADFLPFNQLWQQYAVQLLGVRHFMNEGWTGDLNDTRTVTVQNKFKKIEYFGSMIEVTKSRCPHLVGITGIIVKETKNTFTVVCENDKVKVIPKLHSEFRFRVDGIDFTISGNHLQQRPVERARHNFKKHCLWL